MNIEKLKDEIGDKELRMSQLRIMDANKLSLDIRKLITSLGEGTAALKEQ